MLITFAVVLGSTARDVAKLQQEEADVVEVMKEYREWVRYDNVIVNQGDVIGCIMENRTKVPSVLVQKALVQDDPNAVFNFNLEANFIKYHEWNNGDNSYYLWDGTNYGVTNKKDYDMDALSKYIPPGAVYRSYLRKDANGALLNIWFRRVPVWVKFGNAIISDSDLVNCIRENVNIRDTLCVKTTTIEQNPDINQFSYKWSSSNPATDYDLGFINSMIPGDTSYRVEIVRNAGGQVVYIWFRRV